VWQTIQTLRIRDLANIHPLYNLRALREMAQKQPTPNGANV